jgi:hypothetical protein
VVVGRMFVMPVAPEGRPGCGRAAIAGTSSVLRKATSRRAKLRWLRSPRAGGASDPHFLDSEERKRSTGICVLPLVSSFFIERRERLVPRQGALDVPWRGCPGVPRSLGLSRSFSSRLSSPVLSWDSRRRCWRGQSVRLRLFLLSLLSLALLSPFGKPLVILRYTKHHFFGCVVPHLPCQNTRLFGSLPPMFGVIKNVRMH